MKKFIYIATLTLALGSDAFAQEATPVKGRPEASSDVPQRDPQVPPQPAKPQTKSEDGKRIRFAVSLFYNLADKVTEKGSVTYLGQNLSFNGEDKTTGAAGLGVSLNHRFNSQWGLGYGLGYEFQRTLSSYSITMNGTTVSGDYTTKPTFTVLFLHVDGRFFPAENFYVLAGLNLSKVDVKNSETDIKPAYGAQIGVGYEITENIAVETQYKMIVAKGSSSASVGGNPMTIDYERFELAGLSFLVRYTF